MDVPAGDIGTGGRGIGYLYGQYKLVEPYEGVLTGKGLLPSAALSPAPRRPATASVYFAEKLLTGHKLRQEELVPGSGNVAIAKAQQLGAKVVMKRFQRLDLRRERH